MVVNVIALCGLGRGSRWRVSARGKEQRYYENGGREQVLRLRCVGVWHAPQETSDSYEYCPARELERARNLIH